MRDVDRRLFTNAFWFGPPASALASCACVAVRLQSKRRVTSTLLEVTEYKMIFHR